MKHQTKTESQESLRKDEVLTNLKDTVKTLGNALDKQETLQDEINRLLIKLFHDGVAQKQKASDAELIKIDTLLKEIDKAKKEVETAELGIEFQLTILNKLFPQYIESIKEKISSINKLKLRRVERTYIKRLNIVLIVRIIGISREKQRVFTILPKVLKTLETISSNVKRIMRIWMIRKSKRYLTGYTLYVLNI